ncbi:MAG TPA: hypothetical protein VFX31_02220, partial [Ktedonobacterales bacterium]|nr:hypothetical protein [Ktedonobacterales bacterium]
FTQETVQPGWLFPPDLASVTNLQGDDFSSVVAKQSTLSAELDHLQTQVTNDLTGSGVTVEGP